MIEDDVSDRNVLEAAVRLCTQLDAAGRAVTIRGLLNVAFVSAVQERSDVITTDETVRDGDVLRSARETESIRTLQHDRIVVRRVDAAVRDTDVAAGIDVKAVAIGIDLEIVDREVVYTGSQQREVTAV